MNRIASFLVALVLLAGCSGEKEPVGRAPPGGQDDLTAETPEGSSRPRGEGVILGDPAPMLPGGYRDLPERERENLAKLNLEIDTFDQENGGVMADGRFELRYGFTPAGKIVGLAFFELTSLAYQRVEETLGLEPTERVMVRCVATMEEYSLVTRREWWDFGHIHDDVITLEPIQILFQRGFAQTALTHEYAMYLMMKETGERLPLWMLEGFASLVSDEGPIVRNQIEVLTEVGDDLQPVLTPSQVESTLATSHEMIPVRKAYYNAFLMVRKLQEKYGWDRIARIFPVLAESGDIDATTRRVFGLGYEELLEEVAVGPGDIEFAY